MCRQSLCSLTVSSSSSSRQRTISSSGQVAWYATTTGVSPSDSRRPAAPYQLAGAGGGQEDRHRRAVPGELAQLLAGRHRRLAALQPGQHHRLRDLGDGQLAPARARRPRENAETPGHDLHLEPELGGGRTAPAPPPQRRVTGVHAGDPQALGGGPPVDGETSSADMRAESTSSALAARARALRHDQAGRPDHDVGLGDRRAPRRT